VRRRMRSPFEDYIWGGGIAMLRGFAWEAERLEARSMKFNAAERWGGLPSLLRTPISCRRAGVAPRRRTAAEAEP
jgi:hypothetical protein